MTKDTQNNPQSIVRNLDKYPQHLTVALGETDETMVRLTRETAYNLFTELSHFFSVFAVDNQSKDEDNTARIFCPYRQVYVKMTAESCQISQDKKPPIE